MPQLRGLCRLSRVCIQLTLTLDILLDKPNSVAQRYHTELGLMQGGRALGCRGVRGLGLAFWSGGSVPALPERRWQAPSAERRRLGPERRRLGPERHRPEPSEGHPDSSGLSVLHSVSNNAGLAGKTEYLKTQSPKQKSARVLKLRHKLQAPSAPEHVAHEKGFQGVACQASGYMSACLGIRI